MVEEPEGSGKLEKITIEEVRARLSALDDREGKERKKPKIIVDYIDELNQPSQTFYDSFSAIMAFNMVPNLLLALNNGSEEYSVEATYRMKKRILRRPLHRIDLRISSDSGKEYNMRIKYLD